MLTKNSFMDEIKKQYVLTAKAKGLSENAVLYSHVFVGNDVSAFVQLDACLLCHLMYQRLLKISPEKFFQKNKGK